MKNELRVSEMFYSIQGEGVTSGVPAIFLRLQGCNLTCGGPTTIHTKRIESPATWRCDTIETWLKGDGFSIESILSIWETNQWLDVRFQDAVHLVITGGEPLLQQTQLLSFLKHLKSVYSIFVECETNGTIMPHHSLFSFIDQFNVSPKLSNSGVDLQSRIHPSAIQLFCERSAVFKFVIETESDVDEIFDTFIGPFNIPRKNVCLMPAADSRQDLVSLAPRVAEWAKRHRFRFSSRLHIELWDKKTGV